MSKHTPGPWSCFVWDKTKPNILTIGVPYADGRDHLCKIEVAAHRKEEDEANARLIAAAPELLEACKAMLGLANELGGEKAPYRAVIKRSDAGIAMLAAIAKAEAK